MLNNAHIPTGYDPNEYFFAAKYRQGGRTVFSLDLSVRELVTFLPKPDPEKPLDASATQRRIVPTHAKQFGTYVVEQADWVSPPLLLRAPHIFEFDSRQDLDTGTTQFGTLAVPKDAKSEIAIVDGQHRTLGFHLAWEQLTADISEARTLVGRAKELGERPVIANAEKELQKKVDRRDALAGERVSIQIVLVENPETARRIFLDINDNAKGITGSVKSRFDDRKVLVRALNAVLISNELLEGRVDLEQDRVSGASKYLIGAKHVSEMLHALTNGKRKITPRLEDELDHKNIAIEFTAFTDAIAAAFPELRDVVAGSLTPAQVRSRSLIGSNVVLRAIAGAWFELRQLGWKPAAIQEAFAEMAPHFAVPVFPDVRDSWFQTGVVPARSEGSTSTTSRVQDMKTLTAFIVSQAVKGPDAVWYRATVADPALVVG
ncbi:DNA sulfur modification protein DndB [Demequina iriomotensis]|uniref:DNA sulfur modification protein DndB n=1 Tax=Demequina iriomotensis TaxID=1536641 RepID=UPI000783A08A|nr:DNA sulfur modification protein DndB [Demequina iriomotensis]